MSALSSAGAAAAALLLAWRARPAPARLRALLSPPAPAPTGAGAGPRRSLARRARLVVVAGVVAAATLVWPPALVVMVAGWVAAPRWRRRRAEQRHRQQVEGALPDALDLLALAVGAGATVRQAVTALARVAPEPLGPAFAEVDRRANRGEPLTDALAALPSRLGPPVQPLAAALAAAERDGIAIGPTLDQLSFEARRRRRLAAETAARKLPVRLSFPLVVCVLPAFGLLTLAPLLAGALSSLRL